MQLLNLSVLVYLKIKLKYFNFFSDYDNILKSEGDEMSKHKSTASVISLKESKHKSTSKVIKVASVKHKSNTKVINADDKGNYKSATVVIEPEKLKHKSDTKVLPKKPETKHKSTTSVIEEAKGEHESTSLVISGKRQDLLDMLGMKDQLKRLLEKQDKYQEMLDWYEKKQKNVIEIPEIKINGKSIGTEIVSKTFKVSKAVLKRFIEFANKHSQFKMQDILSMAMIEYIERYH